MSKYFQPHGQIPVPADSPASSRRPASAAGEILMSSLHLHCTRCNGDMSWELIRDGANCVHCRRPLGDLRDNYLKSVNDPAAPDYLENFLAGKKVVS